MLPMPVHLARLEAEAIHIIRETAAAFHRPVVLYSAGKDSSALLHLTLKAFHPSKPAIPLLHVDTTWKFRDMIRFRDEAARRHGLTFIVHTNPEGIAQSLDPVRSGSALFTRVMKTEALRQALDQHGFDAAIGGARRDEEASRAKERIFSVRSAGHGWEPRRQRPELWRLYNTELAAGETMRIFPLSNWTELDVWEYIACKELPVVSLYFAAKRPVVKRQNQFIVVDDERMPLAQGERAQSMIVRFRSLGCYPLTAAVESSATTIEEIIAELRTTRSFERAGRLIDTDEPSSMERKKREGYF